MPKRRIVVLSGTIYILLSVYFIGLTQEYEYPYDSFKDRDILRPLINERGQIIIKEKKEVGNFILQGIMSSTEGNKIVMNNEIFGVGDVIDGYVIKEIGTHKVVLEKEGEEHILKWGGG